MRANTWQGKRDVRVETVPDPQILNDQDAIVRITSTAICGSDLHLYNGFVPSMEPGDILGHEFMGEVVETGRGVRKLKKGDRVVCRSRSPVAGASPVTMGCFRAAKTPTRTRISPRRCGGIPRLEYSGTPI